MLPHRPSSKIFTLTLVISAALFASAAGAETDIHADSPSENDAGAESGSFSAEQLKETARELVDTTSAIRHLAVKQPVAMGVMSRQEILERVRARLDEEYSPEDIAMDKAVLVLLGLLDPEIDYRQAVLDLLTEQVAGFYDPRDRHLNLANWLPLALQQPTIVHEVCHALQDQHFQLLRFVKPLKENTDQQLARTGLVEGDCTAVMIHYLLRGTPVDLSTMSDLVEKLAQSALVGQSQAMSNAPAILRETLLFPYLTGLRFVQQVWKQESLAQLNSVYSRPPLSTEQLIHPKKYWSGELPITFVTPPLASVSPHYTFVRNDTLGEFQLRVLFERVQEQPVARQASAGWGGDRLAIYRIGEETPPTIMLIHRSAWDTELDATQAMAGFVEAWRQLGHREVAQFSPTSPWIFQDASKKSWVLDRRQAQIVAIMAIAPESWKATMQEVWKNWTINPDKQKPSERAPNPPNSSPPGTSAPRPQTSDAVRSSNRAAL